MFSQPVQHAKRVQHKVVLLWPGPIEIVFGDEKRVTRRIYHDLSKSSAICAAIPKLHSHVSDLGRISAVLPGTVIAPS